MKLQVAYLIILLCAPSFIQCATSAQNQFMSCKDITAQQFFIKTIKTGEIQPKKNFHALKTLESIFKNNKQQNFQAIKQASLILEKQHAHWAKQKPLKKPMRNKKDEDLFKTELRILKIPKEISAEDILNNPIYYIASLAPIFMQPILKTEDQKNYPEADLATWITEDPAILHLQSEISAWLIERFIPSHIRFMIDNYMDKYTRYAAHQLEAAVIKSTSDDPITQDIINALANASLDEVIMHELGHALVAIYYKIPVHSIKIFSTEEGSTVHSAINNPQENLQNLLAGTLITTLVGRPLIEEKDINFELVLKMYPHLSKGDTIQATFFATEICIEKNAALFQKTRVGDKLTLEQAQYVLDYLNAQCVAVYRILKKLIAESLEIIPLTPEENKKRTLKDPWLRKPGNLLIPISY